MAAGIDYGMGKANIDRASGIRYGVIPANGAILQAWADSADADYGGPTCPKCGNDAVSSLTETEAEAFDEYEQAAHECADYACDACRYVFGSESAFGEEPDGYSLQDSEYSAASSGTDVFVTRSPYFTLCQFCSPCAPGAGYIESQDPDGIRAFCFGPDWYDEGECDITIYRVSDGSIAFAPPGAPGDAETETEAAAE